MPKPQLGGRCFVKKGKSLGEKIRFSEGESPKECFSKISDSLFRISVIKEKLKNCYSRATTEKNREDEEKRCRQTLQ